MSKRTWVIAGSVAVIGGIGFFLWWKYGRKPKATDTLPLDKSAPTTTPSGTPAAISDRPSDITAFQAFAKNKGADLGKSGVNKDGVDGAWGDKTQKAWDKYKDDYNKSLKTTSDTVQNQANIDSNFNKSVDAIDFLVGGGNIVGKSLIEKGSGKYFNMANKELGTLNKKGYAFGKAIEVLRFPEPNKENEYKIIFTGNNGVKYYTYASMSRVYTG